MWFVAIDGCDCKRGIFLSVQGIYSETSESTRQDRRQVDLSVLFVAVVDSSGFRM